MKDNEIIQLYWDRDEQAIQATSEKFGRYCKAIARNILGNEEDAEECVNDTYFNAWKAMPEHWPRQLAAFLGKITRNLSFNRYKRIHASKRGGGEIALVLEELAECVSGTDDVEQAINCQELAEAINAFVSSLPEAKRNLFVRRYWYAEAISDLAREYAVQPANVSKTLERTRKKLRLYLTERGFSL